MRSTLGTENPYEPTATVNQRMGGVVRSFQVGVDEINTVFVKASFWTGLKIHSTDAAGISGPVHLGACQFEVGIRERHQVLIEVDALARVNAYVDGELVESNLLERLRAVTAVFAVLILAFIGVVLFLFGYLEVDKWIDRWIDSYM